MSLSDTLRKAIEDSDVTLYRIAADSGVPYAVVHRFAAGNRDIRLATADQLADYFGMHLTRPTARPGKKS